MLARCVRAFAGRGPKGEVVSHGMGDVFDLPEGTDWLQAGFVVPVVVKAEEVAEKATVKPAETRKKRGTDGA